MPDRADIQRLATEISKQLADDGRLIEAGWASYRYLVLPPTAPPVQIDECRMAFMAGAQHLFSSIIVILDPGDTEPTEADLKKMDLINAELRAFVREMEQRVTATKGSA